MTAASHFAESLIDGTSETGVIHSINVPQALETRQVWLFYQFTAFVVGKVCDLVFYSVDGETLLRLPALRYPKTGTYTGMAASAQNLCNLLSVVMPAGSTSERPVVAPRNGMFYNPSNGNGFYWLTPFTVKVGCGRIELETNTTATVTYSYLGCLSTDGAIL